jgi:divalent metal cation (Fe/Co/Zn/Cd) transporter
VAAHSGGDIVELHALKTRVSGRVTFIEFHLVVDGGMSVKDSHKVCDKVEKALGEHIRGAQVTIHVEPEGTRH